MALRDIEFEDLCITYKETDESFDHAFGRENKFSFVVVKVEEFCQTYGYKDITNKMSAAMQNKVEKIVERHICNNV